MKAIISESGHLILVEKELPRPKVDDDEVLIKVAAAAMSRSDCVLKNRSLPRPCLPKGDYSLIGNEGSGHVIAVGQNVTRWRIGDRVCAFLDGGGYFEEVAVKADHVLPVPTHISLVQAAGLPIAACTVWLAVFQLGCLSENDTLLIHDSSNIIEMLALQTAKHIGARVLVATETKKRKELFKGLGADLCIDYVKEDLSAKVLKWTKSRGVDVILDVGASNLSEYYKVLRTGGVLAVLYLNIVDNFLEVNMPYLIASNSRIKLFDRVTLSEDKSFLIRKVERNIWPVIEAGMKLFEHKVLPFSLSGVTEARNLVDINEDLDEKILLSTSQSDENVSEPSKIGELRGKGFRLGVPLLKRILKHRKSKMSGGKDTI